MLSQEFKHDYKNILYGIKEYLANDDIEGATDYLNSVISYSSKLLTPDYYFLIKDVPIPAVQGVLISMVKHCEEHGLDVILTVQSFPKKLSMDLIDFIRCFSILINNALEHSIQKIYVSFIGKNNQLEVTVKNTYKEQINLLTIFRKNYSTKKDHAGIGLSIFQKIISSYNNTHYRVDTTKEWITFSFYIE
ncbi:sensor histidine kinase [Carnobacterium maltaromaticum]|uniref:sensor histidine kinase n=1 Tax=Carnobacterium maltaromaticum TaxID=2751 RepID=UPI0015E141F5|nr:GHKL domain-containing protein [Carnobacterium maltaromaticum]